MLQFLLGTAGTGKTTALIEGIERDIRAGAEVILLVPEQLSFETEKLLYRRLGPQLALGLQVLSFTRLCNEIHRKLGGLASVPVTPAARLLLMSIAVEELRDRLTVYRRSCLNTDFLRTLVAACGEFKTAGITPRRLEELGDRWDGPLEDKLRELREIYGAYQGLLDQGYSDGEDDLGRVCELLENRDFFSPYRVYVDGFTTFMAAEFELLGHAIRQGVSVTFALCCDGPQDEQQGMGVLSPVRAAARRLRRMAERDGVPVAESVLFREGVRFRTPALRHLAEQYPLPVGEAFTGAAEGLHLRRAGDRYRELEGVAAAIRDLVEEHGYRYREVAVVARETGPYLLALETVFSRYGIPYFADDPQPVESHPLIGCVLQAVGAVGGNYDTESILLLMKNPVLGLPAEGVAKLENYCYCWGVRGMAWLSDFGANPRGLAGALTEEDLALLQEINELRWGVAEPLQRLREALRTETGQGFAAGIFHFLEEVGAAAHLTVYAGTLPQAEESEFLKDSALIWDELMGILDVFGSVLGNVRMPRRRLVELLRLAVSTVEAGLPPQTLDQVLVGKADRIRPMAPRAVFVVGAAEGEFPAQVATGGVFTDEERRQMIEAGVEIGAPSLERAVLEQYFGYFALTLPSEHLWVSYPQGDLGGGERMPSVLVERLLALFPEAEVTDTDPDRLRMGDKAAFPLLAERLGSGDRVEATLRVHFEAVGRGETLRRMDRALSREDFRIESRALARALFGSRMRLSPTRVERYYRCPFSYFAADGLGVRPRQRVDFSPLESGSVIHNVLQVLVQRHGGQGLLDIPDQALEAEIRDVIEGYIQERAEDPAQLTARFRHLLGRLTGTLSRLLRRLGRELAQSAFEPRAFELPISLEKGVEPLRLTTVDGVSAVVEGVVDRVDVMEKNGKRYVRVVDYKSGAKSFQLSDVLHGLNMQMLLYLFTIAEHGTGELADAIPAGVLYMPVGERFLSADRGESTEALLAAQEKQWRMSGLLLEDEEALRGMERDLRGIFIPAKLGKDGRPDAKSSLAGKAEMGRLAGKVKELVAGMAAALSEGGVAALPAQGSDYRTCDYCDYRAVCGIEPGDPVKEIGALDRAAVLERLEEEGEQHG